VLKWNIQIFESSILLYLGITALAYLSKRIVLDNQLYYANNQHGEIL